MNRRQGTAKRIPSAAMLVCCGLLLTAIGHLGYQLTLGVQPADVGPFETVLAQTVAGHFEPAAGPGRFYGPYDGDHPSVLMHAPLYYRLVALLAWPFASIGADPLTMALYAGRSLSFCGALALAFATMKMALADGSPLRGGWLSLALLFASPILGNLVVMLRPDVLGVALQSMGAWLVLRQLDRLDRTRAPTGHGPVGTSVGSLALAFVLFALAFAVKQQNVSVGFAAGGLLMAAALRGRVVARSLAIAASAAGAFVLVWLLIENIVTGGRMWQAVFAYPSGPFRSINYAGWTHVFSIVEITLKRSMGLLLVAAVSVGLVGIRRQRNPLDARLVFFLVAELFALVPLCLYNAGAAYNYALQAIVFGCVVAGRMLDRALRVIPAWPWLRHRAAVGALCAGVCVLALADVRWAVQESIARGRRQAELNALESNSMVRETPSDARYFVRNQDLNRLYGRRNLIHDDWLYGAFEHVGGAQPRQTWLKAALTRGPVRQVVTTDDSNLVPGIEEPLQCLGYERVAQFDELTLWQRR